VLVGSMTWRVGESGRACLVLCGLALALSGVALGRFARSGC
jgi:hypothetical protein